jgi:hypothetical protein
MKEDKSDNELGMRERDFQKAIAEFDPKFRTGSMTWEPEPECDSEQEDTENNSEKST